MRCKNRLIILLIVFHVFSCSKTPDKIEYYATGEVQIEKFFSNDSTIILKDYYRTGNLRSISKKVKGKFEGEYQEFFENGKLKEIGRFYNNKPYGWCYYYNADGTLKAKREFIMLDTISYMNQVIYYDNKQNIIKDKSNFFSLYSKSDTIMFGEEYNLLIKLDAPYFNNKIDITIGEFDSLYTIPENSEVMVAAAVNFQKEYNYKPKRRGKHIIRGIITEYSRELIDSLNVPYTRQLYFTKEFFVK